MERIIIIGIIVAAAASAFTAGCSSPTSRPEPHARSLDAGAFAASAPVERVTRYYVDETGAVWDDRGRKYEAVP